MIPALIGAAVVAAGVACALSGDDKKSTNTTVREIPASEVPPEIRKKLEATHNYDEQIPASEVLPEIRKKLDATHNYDEQIPAWARRNS